MMNKQNVVYSHNEIVFSLKQEGNSIPATIWMNPEDVMLRDTGQSLKDRHCMIQLGLRHLE